MKVIVLGLSLLLLIIIIITITSGKSVISNKNINLSACKLLLLSVIRPNIGYGSEVWEGNASQAGS